MTKICYLSDANSSHTQKWVDYFSNHYDEIHLISMRLSNYAYKENVKLYVIEPPYKNKLSYFFIINKIKKLVQNINPDLIHSHYATSYGLYGRLSGIRPFIVSVWGSDVYDFPKSNKFKSNLLRYILKGSDVVCSTSFDMAKEILKYYDKNDIEITPFGVDTNLFNITSNILENDYITIGLCKHLRPVYGINFLIEAFALLSKEVNKDLKLLIVGDGEERLNLEKLTKSLHIQDKVTFTGDVKNKYVSHFINKMDIVCLPSIRESFGVAAVEASACGRPVVCSNVGGLKEVVIDGETGFLFKSQDVIDLKNKLKLLVENESLMRKFSSSGRQFVLENYNWEDNAKHMYDIYSKLLKK